jgi:hypothetical protein
MKVTAITRITKPLDRFLVASGHQKTALVQRVSNAVRRCRVPQGCAGHQAGD